jgi:hypothetical protein
VGVVLRLDGDEARRRSAQVVSGLTEGLGLPAAAADVGAVRLLTESAQGSDISSALARLAGAGALILVAGVDPPSAASALAFARETKIPILLLTAPEAGTASPAFVLGEPPEVFEGLLDDALRKSGHLKVAHLGTQAEPCVEFGHSSAGRYPVAQWKRDRVTAVALLGPPTCSKDVLAELARARFVPTIALGAESAVLANEPSAHRRYVVSAGSYPAVSGSGVATDEAVLDRGWFSHLGRDAAALCRAALVDFPMQLTDDASAVADLHQRAAESIARARATLLTTESPGFLGSRRMARTLKVVEVEAAREGAP